MNEVVTATLWITLGVTFYNIPAPLACPGYEYATTGEWAAMPIEWNKAGYVSCGDTLFVEYSDGTKWFGPVLDFGCHLHYPIWDSGKPFGVDFPVHMAQGLGPTRTARMSVYRKELDRWWTVPPTTAWWTKDCDGPLTVRPTPSRRFIPE